MRFLRDTRAYTDLTELRGSIYHRLAGYLTPAQLAAAERCARKLREALPQGDLSQSTVLVAYGGGKDSSYMLAFVRIMQLILGRESGRTFTLRAATNRHAGMPMAVMANIDRAYDALGLYDDPDAETLLVDGNEVRAFVRGQPLPAAVRERNRLDILMTGHRTQADPRPTFCNACNLSMINSFGVAAQHGGGVDAIVTGDSPREQRAYAVWVARLGQQLGLDPGAQGKGLGSLLKTLNVLSGRYFEEIYGPGAAREIGERRVTDTLRRVPVFFSIYDDAVYSLKDHCELLTAFLGFDFDDLAFSFSESDCGNPALMAHLRGLKCERLFQRSYDEGIREYLGFGVSLMRDKQFPEALIQMIQARYQSPLGISLMRQRAGRFAAEAFHLREDHMVCMIYAPFTDHGRNLALYLQRERPALAGQQDEIHRLLGAGSGDEGTALARALEQASGLTLAQLRQCYRSPMINDQADPASPSLITKILRRDPHKAVIQTRHHPDGPVVHEQISGR